VLRKSLGIPVYSEEQKLYFCVTKPRLRDRGLPASGRANNNTDFCINYCIQTGGSPAICYRTSPERAVVSALNAGAKNRDPVYLAYGVFPERPGTSRTQPSFGPFPHEGGNSVLYRGGMIVVHVLKSNPQGLGTWPLKRSQPPKPNRILVAVSQYYYRELLLLNTFCHLPSSFPLPSSAIPLDLVGNYGCWHLGNIHTGVSFEWGSLRRWNVTGKLQLKSPSRRGPRTLPQPRTTLKRLCDKHTTDHALLPNT
jgi:hypothetical protein